MSDPLNQATTVLRAISGDDPDRFAATRLRLRRDLEQRAHGRRRFATLGILLGVTFGGTTAWALATDNVARMWSAIDGAAMRRAREVPAREAPAREVLSRAAVPAENRAVSLEPTWAGASEPVATPVREPLVENRPVSLEPVAAPVRAPEPATRPRVRRVQHAPTATPVDALYRRAHELHFRGDDTAAALAAWDAYLGAEPAGRFAIEARYNRALLWIRMGRYRDAHAALLPFARGEVSGYRQEEAATLVARLARLNDPAPTGHDAP